MKLEELENELLVDTATYLEKLRLTLFIATYSFEEYVATHKRKQLQLTLNKMFDVCREICQLCE